MACSSSRLASATSEPSPIGTGAGGGAQPPSLLRRRWRLCEHRRQTSRVPPNPGVFRLVNHGVPRDLTARLFRLTRDLLDTDPGEKDLPGYFGGTPVPSLRVKEYVAHMARITRKLFYALADGGEELALDAAQRTSYLEEHGGTFRAYRYPACDPAGQYLGMEPHTDNSVMSILNMDLVGGLKVLVPGGAQGGGAAVGN
ncbi:gibberellin 2-beta-dioxygenase 8-like [Lolium perenne]|uniref:gibberellin 2-beta-dioxygenase 8-like n=1 Tax=Lolium perenne TaxID=4522 RepID=UPI0021F6168C|nr:gibberellin 2-beta-dioxygenase 8-like [Lolium perenne]